MTSRDFCFWLQGFLELNAAADDGSADQRPRLDVKQVECVKRHLALVFTHEIDPSMGPAKHQATLDTLHNAGGGGPTFRC